MKVQNEMSTRISVDAVSAIGSMSAFRNAIRGASDAWRAQEVALRNSGNFAEAAKTRLSGLNQVIDLQKAKVEELRQRQEGLDASNQKQADQFLKLERQIQQANRQLASYEGQAERARNAVRYQTSGLAALQHAYRQSQSASTAYINRLNAEGRSASATVEKYRTLRSNLANLQAQYQKQESLLKQVANESGKDSDAYVKQREQLDKTATSIAKTRSELKQLSSENARLQPTGIKKVDDAVITLNNHTAKLRSRMTSAFESMKTHAMGLAITIGGTVSFIASSASKAADVQKVMVENQNLMTTAGEKAASAQKEVNQMYSDGEKYSVQYGVSQHTIANGYQELIKRGYDGRQALGAMKSILEASRASGDDFNDTMKVTTSTLEAFGMRSESTTGMMKNTAKAADILAKAADVTSTSFQNIGVGMEYAGSSAKQSGVSMRDTAAALGVLSNNGLEASQAGTGLQRILSRLAVPTSTAKDELKKYNLSIDDFKDKSGKLKSIPTIFQDINKHVPKAEQLEFFNKVFGQTAQNAAGILSRTASLNRDNSQSLQHVEDQLKTAYSEDYVGKLARKNMNSAKNAQDRFKYASQAIQIEIGRNMLPAISRASQSMANAFGRKDTQNGLKVLAKGLGDVANAAVSLLTFIGKHTTTVKIFGGALVAAFGAAKLLDAIGTTRRRINDLRAVISKIPTRKHTNFTADTQHAQQNIKSVNREMDRVPNNKRSSITVDSRGAVANTKAVGTASKEAAATSKLSFASIGTAAKTAGTTISMAFRANPLGMIVTGVQIAISAFKLLYAHSKTFRKFVNGLSSAAKSAMSKVGHWFSSTFKKINSAQQKSNRAQQKANQQNQRAWNNYWKQHNRAAEQNQRKLERAEQASQRRRSRAIANFNKEVARGSNNMWKSLQRDTDNGVRGAERGWKNLERSAQRGSNNVGRWYAQMEKNTGRTIQQMSKEHPRTFGAMYKVIEDRSRTWHDVVTGHWDRLNNDTQNTAKDMSDAHRQLFGAMYDKLNDLTHGGLDQMSDYWSNTLNKIHDAVVNIGGTIHNAFDSLMNGLIDIFSGLINGIVDGINWVLNHVGGDGNLQKVNLKHFAKGSNGPISKRQLAVLNDASDNDYREMVHKHKTGETFMLPAKRNIVMPLEPGDEVLDGKRAAKLMALMGTPVHHADGVIGDFFSGIFDKSKDALEDATDWVDKALKNVIGFGKSLFNHFMQVVTPKSTDSLNSALKVSLPGFFANRLKDWLKKQLDLLNTADPPGTGVERWKPLVLRALKMLGLSEGLVGKVLRQIQTESGGNPKAMGGTDGLSDGHAEGLMQVKPPTFNAYKLSGHDNIWNGFDNLLAGLNYAKHRYGSDLSFLGQGHGYAYGGLVNQHGLYEVAENNNPEMIVPLDPNKRGRAYELLTQVLAQFKSEDTNGASSSSDQQVQNLSRKFDALLAQNQQLINLVDKLIGVTDSANNPTARYRRTQRDINMAQAQSLIH